VLGKSRKLLNHVEFLEDKVHAVSAGELAFVVSRRLLLNVAACAALLALVAWKLAGADPVMGNPVEDSWPQFKDRCGNSVFLSRTADVREYQQLIGRCQYAYIGSTFQNWEGYIIKVQDNRSQYFDFFHSMKLLVGWSHPQVKMDPEDNLDKVDLVIDVNFDKAKTLRQELEKLDIGQGIVFNATLRSLQVANPNHLHLVSPPQPRSASRSQTRSERSPNSSS
jgi:hypothetical protein